MGWVLVKLCGLILVLGGLTATGVAAVNHFVFGVNPGCRIESMQSGVVLESENDREWRKRSELTASQKRSVSCASGDPVLHR